MSASSKKKLRTENEAGKLTERQLAEQKEAKNVKLYTAAFAVVLVLLIVVAAVAGVNSAIESSGSHQKNTVAVTVGGHSLSNAELSYYYMDAINNFNNNYGSYAFMYGLDTSKPLSQQVVDEASGETWADNFIEEAIGSARAVFALVDEAKANGFTLPEEQKSSLDIMASNLDAYATMYGYSNADDFIKAQYGNGTSKDSYLEYYERNMLASAYQSSHQGSLVYTADQIRAFDSENSAQFNSYNYNQYVVSVSKFLTGGTTDADGNTTYTDEERNAAVSEAEAAANSLVNGIDSVEALDAAIAALPVNAGTDAHSSVMTNIPYSSINSNLVEWVTDSARVAGDMTVVPVKTSTDGIESVLSYMVVYFDSVNTNETNMVNVRHILLPFSGETNEDGTYTDAAKAEVKASAEDILNQWKNGDATEESFAALANEKSTDSGSNGNGGLYENVYPGQMVATFDAWCFDADRKAGDTGVVETEYGYHVMYFSGVCDQTFRDFNITNTLLSNDMNAWYTALLDGCTVVNGDTRYMNKDIVLAR